MTQESSMMTRLWITRELSVSMRGRGDGIGSIYSNSWTHPKWWIFLQARLHVKRTPSRSLSEWLGGWEDWEEEERGCLHTYTHKKHTHTPLYLPDKHRVSTDSQPRQKVLASWHRVHWVGSLTWNTTMTRLQHQLLVTDPLQCWETRKSRHSHRGNLCFVNQRIMKTARKHRCE